MSYAETGKFNRKSQDASWMCQERIREQSTRCNIATLRSKLRLSRCSIINIGDDLPMELAKKETKTYFTTRNAPAKSIGTTLEYVVKRLRSLYNIVRTTLVRDQNPERVDKEVGVC